MIGVVRRRVMGGGGAAPEAWSGVTLTAVEDCTFTFTLGSSLTAAQYEYLEYSLDQGATWTRLTNVNSTTVTATTTTVTTGNTVYVRGKGTKMGYYKNATNISASGLFDASGDIMSLLYPTKYTGKELVSTNDFEGLFRATTIRDASQLVLSPTTLRGRSYANMFYGCTSLVSAPQMNFTSFDNGATGSCSEMFSGCTNLANVQSTLYPTTLSAQCYTQMFRDCKALVNAPALPATALVSGCYQFMFYGCTHLQYLKCMTLTELSTTYSQWWVLNVPSGGTFVKNSAATWTDTFTRNTIPSEGGAWTVITANS